MEAKPVACIAGNPNARTVTLRGVMVDCQKIANSIGMNRSYIWRVLNGHRYPHIHTAVRIAGALGMELSEFVNACEENGRAGIAIRKAEVQQHLDRIKREDEADLATYAKGRIPRPRTEVLRTY